MALSAPRMMNEFNESEYELKELLSQPKGFERYAEEKMPEFIQIQRDYEGFVRDVIVSTTVTPEDLSRDENEQVYVTYSKDVDATAAFMPRNGETPTLRVQGKTVQVGFRTIETPALTITQYELDTQPYDLMRRTQEKAAQAMARLEDEWFLKSANALVEGPGKDTQIVTQSEMEITKAGLVAVKQVFSGNDVAFQGYLMSPVTYDSFLLWGENDLDDTTQRTVLETGHIPTIWGGLTMVTSITVPKKYVYGLAPKKILGRMPILRDLTLDVQRIPRTKDKEVLAYEFVGMFIHSHLAIARLELGVA